MEFKHYTVLKEEAVELLDIKEGGVYVDCTLGGAGHTELILEKLKGGRVIGIDRDEDALRAAAERLNDDRFAAVKSNFSELDTVLSQLNIDAVDGILMDLGVSSYQLDTAERGFSYNNEGPLDMRMDTSAPLDGAMVINGYSAEELSRIFYEYGEERYSRRIAAEIEKRRSVSPYTTTTQLYDTVYETIRGSKTDKLSSVKRVFQAVRIEVNGELSAVEDAIDKGIKLLKPQGRIAIISFHSLEDRIVKTRFGSAAKGCDCPPDLPICVCGKKPIIKLITRKPVLPSQKELAENSRSHSAKLRCGEKI
ncbi:MAG: 16S rRNA (cytosine(1402)-N(4))-methyltransferase RsmH [Clostridia bacterium]|nr:16S rRNA (cytosine(1402)-N(4))-methyltransferase RsmH [Clostridia bacterium]MBQ7047886.1 16S rRNA (cytosine(1402)-N(4))-methyltransferase RsmH [Clostridia bacterium]